MVLCERPGIAIILVQSVDFIQTDFGYEFSERPLVLAMSTDFSNRLVRERVSVVQQSRRHLVLD